MTVDEIRKTVSNYAHAAVNAMEAGFDGVEIQAANSHLIDQFLQDGTNKRTDVYGGPAENRIRFLLEIVDQVGAAIGTNRLGVRLSPFGQYGGIHDSNPLHLFGIAINALDEREIAYLHLIEGRGSEIGLTDGLHEDALTTPNCSVPTSEDP
jgi:N-ethylmaleimide reductase